MRVKPIRIPGKVMLSGEYAVLHGATAVMLPVPRYLVFNRAKDPPAASYTRMVDVARRYPIIELAKHERENGVPHIDIDYSQFFAVNDRGTSFKLGLGMSSAEVVGVVAMRYACAGFDWKEKRQDAAKHAFCIHKQVQWGIGSGADVVACAYGVPIKFRSNGSSFEATPIEMNGNGENCPPMALIWSGSPADTRELVRQFDGWLEDGNAGETGLLDKLIEASDRLADSWFRTSTEKQYELLDQFDRAIRECARAAGIPYSLPAHENIRIWAARHGGRAKPTGAGAGDMILIMGSVPFEQLDKLVIPLDLHE